MTMKIEKLGIIAGKGEYPFIVAREARNHGVKQIIGIGFHGDTNPEFEKEVHSFHWLYVGQLSKMIRIFSKQNVEYLMMAGQVTPGRLFQGFRPDLRALRLLARVHPKNATTIFGALIEELKKEGLIVLPATTFLEDHLASAGIIGKVKPTSEQMKDIELGIQIARQISALDIGQTVVIKKGVILAIEAFEGTDAAIRRGGELGKGEVVVVKLAKHNQDYRFDIPCVGLQTVQSLKEAQAKVLAVEAGITLFLNKVQVVEECNRLGICLYGFYDGKIDQERKEKGNFYV